MRPSPSEPGAERAPSARGRARGRREPGPSAPVPGAAGPGQSGPGGPAPSGRASRHRYLAALVLDGRAAAEVDGLRRALRPSLVDRVPPHITLLAPVNVRDDAAESALALLRRAAAASRPIAVELGPVATFLPRSPVLYLRVSGDVDELEALRARLAAGPLAPPQGREPRAFVPHVTLTNRAEHAAAATLTEALSGFRLPVSFTRLTLLEQDVAAEGHPWNEIADAALGTPAVVGRGGLDVELSVSGRLDPSVARWATGASDADAREAYGPSWSPDAPFAVVARHRGELLGVATGEVRGDCCELRRLIVAPEHRRAGVGSHLLRFVERLAAERGCERVRLRTIAAGPAEGFYTRRGYAVLATLPRWRGGLDFAVMERKLPGSRGAGAPVTGTT